MMVFSERLPDWTAAWHRPLLPLGLQTMQRWQQTGDVCAALNACEGAAGVRFVPQEELPAGMAYEQFIYDTRQVPTRSNWHDFFNGLM